MMWQKQWRENCSARTFWRSHVHTACTQENMFLVRVLGVCERTRTTTTCTHLTWNEKKKKEKRFWHLQCVKLRFHLFIFFICLQVEQKRVIIVIYYSKIIQNVVLGHRCHHRAAAAHANFATGFDERATHRNWLSACTASTRFRFLPSFLPSYRRTSGENRIHVSPPS